MNGVVKAGVILILGGLTANSVPALEDGVVEGCVACHKGALDLSEKRVSDLLALMQAMIAGNRAHVVPLPALSDADLEELALALGRGEER